MIYVLQKKDGMKREGKQKPNRIVWLENPTMQRAVKEKS